MRRLVLLLSSLSLLSALLVAPLLAAPAQAGAPSQARWQDDVQHAMHGSQAYLRQQVAQGGRLAINLDIDNTSLATHYDPGAPVAPVLAFARLAHRQGVTVFFNTGRTHQSARSVAKQLARVGYTVDGLCSRNSGERLAHSKQRCRQLLVDQGFTIVADVGNNPTDFAGRDYQRAFRLPNYGGALS